MVNERVKELADGGKVNEGQIKADIDNLKQQLAHYEGELALFETNPAKGLEQGKGHVDAQSAASFRKKLSGRKDIAEHFRGEPERRASSTPRTRRSRRKGSGRKARAAIEQLLKPAKGKKALNQETLTHAMETLDHLASVVQEREDLLTLDGLRHTYDSLEAFKRDLVGAYKDGKTLEGHPLTERPSAKLTDAMANVEKGFKKFNDSKSTNPVERLMELLRLRDTVARAGTLLRGHAPLFAGGETLGKATKSDIIDGLQQREIEVNAAGRVADSLIRAGFEKREIHRAPSRS